MTKSTYPTKYQLEHLKERINNEIDPLIQQAELSVKSIVADLTENAELKLAKKIKADFPFGEVGFFYSYISKILKRVFLQKLLHPRDNTLVSIFHHIVPSILNTVNFCVWKNPLPSFQEMVVEHKIFSTPCNHYRK